jgi:zinc transport system substrate-binding protein
MKFLSFFLLIFFVSSKLWAQTYLPKKPIFAASINPIYQILLAITKDQNNSRLIIKPNFSEHDYQLKKSDVQNLAKADLIFFVDENLEKNLTKFIRQKKSYQLSKINKIKLLAQREITKLENTNFNKEQKSIANEATRSATHSKEISFVSNQSPRSNSKSTQIQRRSNLIEHNSKKTDLHLWLNPQNAIKIAEFMAQKICEIDASNCQKYQDNLAEFSKDVEKTANKIVQNLEKTKGKNYVFYHDGYQYFEDYFGLNPLMVVSNNHELGILKFKRFSQLAKTTKIECLFGDIYDEKNSAKNLAKQNNIPFAKLDLLGQNGNYQDLILKISKEIIFCLG